MSPTRRVTPSLAWSIVKSSRSGRSRRALAPAAERLGADVFTAEVACGERDDLVTVLAVPV